MERCDSIAHKEEIFLTIELEKSEEPVTGSPCKKDYIGLIFQLSRQIVCIHLALLYRLRVGF